MKNIKSKFVPAVMVFAGLLSCVMPVQAQTAADNFDHAVIDAMVHYRTMSLKERIQARPEFENLLENYAKHKAAALFITENGISAPATVPGQPADEASYSKTYAEVRSNNDGSTTIVSPAFKDPAGLGSLRINGSYSSLDGVCKLFGFGAAQASANTVKNFPFPTVYINSLGKLAGVTTKGRYRWLLDYLTCAPGKASESLATPSAPERAEKISRNDDGSFTVLRPFVEGEKGEKIPISAYSDGQGVCRYFGFSRYVTDLTSAVDRDSITAGISHEGRISGFNSVIRVKFDSMVCE